MAGNIVEPDRSGKSEPRRGKRPEKKIAPYGNGLGVAIWINEIESEGGARLVRSITINPKRYFNRDTGEWQDSGSLNIADIPAVIAVLQKAFDFCVSTPITGQAAAATGVEADLPHGEGDDIPF
jgi:hypothetical protein